ncbi:MAG: hypothetical protein GX220_01035 [Treponema sp.]|nr:hypothetical protein [Treponema sp.]
MVSIIFFVIFIVIICLFIGFNLNNVCSIWLFGKVLENVPVFLIVFISVGIGALLMLPFCFSKKTPKKQKAEQNIKSQNTPEISEPQKDESKKSKIKIR